LVAAQSGAAFRKKKKKERDIHLAAPVASFAKGKRFFTSSE
jgi:hypothetical protein